jgi:hypothetical protein
MHVVGVSDGIAVSERRYDTSLGGPFETRAQGGGALGHSTQMWSVERQGRACCGRRAYPIRERICSAPFGVGGWRLAGMPTRAAAGSGPCRSLT